jgi:lysyl-tRNA synthetase class 2
MDQQLSNQTRSYEEIRQEELQQYSQQFDCELYPHPLPVTFQSLHQFRDTYGHLTETGGQVLNDVSVSVSGRIIHKRRCGKKLAFYHIEKGAHRLQLLCNFKFYPNKEHFRAINNILRRGDLVHITGHPGSSNPRNHDPELSIFVTEIVLQAPCMHELPCNEGGFSDVGLRYKKRHLDLILRPQIRQVLQTRSRIISNIRQFLNSHNFLEVETPVLSGHAHGAVAKPFVTHHNDLEMDMHLRIAPELYLKRLIIGGLPRVYEIGKLFRNEAVDQTHNPEFTSCEFYMVDQDYNGLMLLTEQMLECITQTISESKTEESEFQFKGPYPRIDFMTGLRDYAGFSLPPTASLDSEEVHSHLCDLMEQHGLVCEPKTTAKMLDKLCSEFVEPRCVQPTFIINHPQIMSPLAKQHRDHPQLTERFELFVKGRELCNAYTELNDPVVQQTRFEEQQRQKSGGDEEIQLPDDTFVEALEYGLPPTAGWGMGIDRLVMILTGNECIREVLAFPHIK